MLRATCVLMFAAVFAVSSARNSLPDAFATFDAHHHTNNNIEPLETLDNMVEPSCSLDIQVVQTKKVNGRCIKLTGGTPGCAAGSYLHPFHPDCLANF